MASLVSLETSPLANMQPLARELLHRVKYFAYTTGLSLLTAMAISGQRCLSILFPTWYKRHRPGGWWLACVQHSGRCPSS